MQTSSSLLLRCLLGFVSYVLPAFASWTVTYPERLSSVKDSCVLIPCTFSYPRDVVISQGIIAIWYRDHSNQRTVVYHSATPNTIDAQFRDRAELIGDLLTKNCTLLLRRLATEDSGSYSFRFEISERNRWTAQRAVQLTITEAPAVPTITAPENLREGMPVTFNCTSPYVCPYGSFSLRWTGYNTEVWHVSGRVQLDTAGALRKQTLSASLSWQDHNRKMSCELTVGSKVAASQVTLRVKHSPKGVKASLSPSSKNIRVGEAASLTCSVTSSYPAITAYRWQKDGVASGNRALKTIPSVAREDYGLYHCEAENSVGAGVSGGVMLYVFSAVLSVSPSSSIMEGETVTLTCDIPGEDKQEIHYSWYKNNIWIKEGTVRSLVFHQVAFGDTGYYACKVQNDKGSEMSQTIGLTVFYPPRTPLLSLFQETQEGRLALVSCTVDSNPQSVLSLYRDQELLATTSSQAAPSQRISISTTRNALKLEIQKVIPEDEGEYQCVATNTYGNATTVRFFGAQTARVVVSPSTEISEGQRVTLTCVATLGPEEGTTYTWYKDAKWLQDGKEDVLVFPAVASRDAGTFSCLAHNQEGSHRSPAVTLHVLYPPTLPVMSSFLETQGGQLGILQCTVDSEPPSEVAVYKGELLLGSTSKAGSPALPRVSLTSAHNTLKVTIKDVMLEDEGQYVCSAQNRFGESSSTLDFTAETARITITPSPEVREGETVRLSCTVSGNSSALANYTWSRNGLQLPEAPGNSLEIPHVARGDAGSYSCRVENPPASRSSTPVALSVLYPPGTPQAAVFMETERGRVALFQCSVDSNPPSKLVLYKGGEVIASSGSESSVAPQRVSVTTAHNAMRVELRGIVPEDGGSYNVTAANPYGSSSRLLFFRVQTARVLVTPSPELLEGDPVTLTCDLMGSAVDDSTFSWYRNSKHLPERNAKELTFLRITSGDAGYYHCKAHTPEETAISVSPAVSIIVFYPPRKPQLASFLQTQEGQVALIHCTVDSDPQSQLAMYRGGALWASSAGSSASHDQRLSISAAYNSLRVEIRDVLMEDEGEYLCSASNLYGNASSSVTFTADPARIWISPPDVLEGLSVNLTCAVDSDASSQPHYTWYKDSRWQAEGPSKTLSLPSVTTADGGAYYCTVKTPHRTRNSSLGTLNVLYPPRNAWMKSFLETSQGKLAILVCSVDSNPPSELSLRRGNQVLAASSSRVSGVPDPRLSVASSPNSLRLEIRDVHLDDEGLYECLVSNTVGTTSVSLDFTVETTRVVIKPVPDVREGDPVSLTCEDAASPTNAIYAWSKNSRWLAEGPAASLVFQSVASSDMGSYSCQVHDERGTRKSPPVVLQVLYAPKKPSLTSFRETQSGNRAIMQCTVESNPLSDIALYRGSEMVASSRSSGHLPAPRLHVHSAPNALKVEIMEILLEDEGQYLCSANNTYGASTTSTHFSVDSAKITVNPSPDIREGGRANLTCVVASQALGDMNYTWYKNSRWLQEGPEPSLLLGGVARDDAGSYHCQATGMRGSLTSALVILNVLYAPKSPSVSAFLDNQHGKVGILHCQVDSHPRAQLAFFKGAQLVADPQSCCSAAAQHVLAFPSYNSLRLEIRDVTAEDSGRYTCLASNSLGNATGTVDLSAETLSDLHLFKILAMIFIAVTGVAVLGGLVLGVQRSWPRINEEWKKWKPRKAKQAASVEVENKEEMAQLNEENPGTPPSGRLCLSYKRLRAKAEATPKETPPEQSCTSVL
ncbi:sialoadhesin [Hemicordylus capensis]|uniref:sialoadhesin n=1 Tax=Hemicordylus capensis TaxID=884348 RepID=UPI00230364C4|nr:sialoadhesin [Hemicordylus capensis]